MNTQKIEVVGRAVASPEVKTSKDNNPYAKISIAANWEKKDKKGKKKEEVTFYNILVFGKRAEKSENIEKGRLLRTVGELEARPYVNKKGEAKVDLTVLAREFQVLDTEVFK